MAKATRNSEIESPKRRDFLNTAIGAAGVAGGATLFGGTVMHGDAAGRLDAAAELKTTPPEDTKTTHQQAEAAMVVGGATYAAGTAGSEYTRRDFIPVALTTTAAAALIHGEMREDARRDWLERKKDQNKPGKNWQDRTAPSAAAASTSPRK